nr:uncharacterized protein LOC129523497 [Gorilla gorilla gorilla]
MPGSERGAREGRVYWHVEGPARVRGSPCPGRRGCRRLSSVGVGAGGCEAVYIGLLRVSPLGAASPLPLRRDERPRQAWESPSAPSGVKSKAGRIRRGLGPSSSSFLFSGLPCRHHGKFPNWTDPARVTSSRAEPAQAGPGVLGAGWRGWAPLGRGSAPPALVADCALGGHADRRGRARARLLWAKDQGPCLG